PEPRRGGRRDPEGLRRAPRTDRTSRADGLGGWPRGAPQEDSSDGCRRCDPEIGVGQDPAPRAGRAGAREPRRRINWGPQRIAIKRPVTWATATPAQQFKAATIPMASNRTMTKIWEEPPARRSSKQRQRGRLLDRDSNARVSQEL